MDSANTLAVESPWLKRVSFGSNSYFTLFFVVLGALPLYLPLVILIGEKAAGAQQPIPWVFWANLFVSMPHTCATYARLSRKISEKKVSFWFGLPAYGLCLAFLLVATIKGFFLEVFTLVNVWQSYHYLRQVYGVSRYFGRSKDEPEKAQKLSFAAYHLAIPLFTLGRWDLLYTVWHGKASEFIIPLNIPDPILNVCWVLAAVGLVLGLSAEAIKFKQANEYDATGLLILLVYFAIHWFGFLSYDFYARGFLAITIFHAVQYIAVVFLLEEKQESSPRFATKRFLDLAPHGLTFLAFGTLLFFIGAAVQDYVFTLPNILYAKFSAVCLSTISAHHYLVDTVMWGRKTGP